MSLNVNGIQMRILIKLLDGPIGQSIIYSFFQIGKKNLLPQLDGLMKQNYIKYYKVLSEHGREIGVYEITKEGKVCVETLIKEAQMRTKAWSTRLQKK